MSDAYRTIERLPFRLPDFTRHVWVSDRAQSVWSPRLARIRDAWAEVEWLSVVDRVRRCALVAVPHEQLPDIIGRWSRHGLSAMGVPVGEAEAPRGLVFAVVGSSLADVTDAHRTWVARSDDALGCLLGYPDCCRKFFTEVWVGARCTDTTWAMATHTAAATDGLVVVEPGVSALANILWRWLGVRAVPHLPCRFDCAASIRFGAQFLQVAERAGFVEEAKWIHEILSWPVEWSALHGIAEIKTPILKIATRTDAGARKYTTRWTGLTYPQEGATGLHFPYVAPRRAPVSGGRTFQLAQQQIATAAPVDAEWQYSDNGFASAAAMTAMHAPILAEAHARLAGADGHVLDLGCGNGALLAALCADRPGRIPHGIDTNGVAIAHAATLQPQFADNFIVADLFDAGKWLRGRRYALSVLMAGRLLEVERGVALALVAQLKSVSDAILLYVYPSSGQRSLASIAAELGLRLQQSNAESVAWLIATAAPEHRGIDWTRLAEPQADQYDSDVILRLVSTTTSVERPLAYRRALPGDAPTTFDGRVAVRHVYQGQPEFAAFHSNYADAPLDHPNVDAAAGLVRSWPRAYAQCQRLLDTIHPALDPRIQVEPGALYQGSSCHSLERLFGTLWSTVYCPLGLAEAIVHEMAHQKLRGLGVSFESAKTIVGNRSADRYQSPVIKDRQRPMTAVLHAEYSYVHVTCLDAHVLEAERDSNRQAVLRLVLARNLARIEEGQATLRAHFEPGDFGREFMDGFYAWIEDTIARGKRLVT